jgi:hypothetical protein
MTTSKLPRRFALVGVLLGITWMGLYLYDYKYNPFHLPPPSPLYKFLEGVMFVLCPGLFLQIFTIGTGDTMSWIMWTIAVILNGPIYYGLGWVLVAAGARFESLHARH